MKRMLPVVALLTLVSMGGYLWLSRSAAVDIDVSLASTVIDNGNLVMSNPKINGKTRDGRDYAVTASRAIQPMDGTETIEMQDVDAQFTMDDGSDANLQAPVGILDRAQDRLTLTGPSVFSTGEGVRIAFTSADVGIDSGSFSTDEPVTVEQPGTRIDAQSMQVSDNGANVVFEGKVRVVLSGSVASGMGSLSAPSPTPAGPRADAATEEQEPTR